MKRIAGWAIGLTAVVLGAAPAWSAEGASPRSTSRSLADPAGDVVDSEGAKLNDARGDLLQAAVDYRTDGVQFEVRLAKFTDPVKDPNWNSDSTYLLWMLDTDGDGEADFTIEYGNQDGQLYGAVFKAGATKDAPAICSSPSVPVGPSGEYVLRLDSRCIGQPDSFAWSVEASYDTNPKNDDAPATEDLLPDRGFSPRVYAPAGSPASAPGSATSSPTDADASAPGGTGGGQSNGPAGANGDAATSASSSAAATAGGSSAATGQGANAGGAATNAFAAAEASSSSQAPGGSTATSGTASGAAAKAKAAAAAENDATSQDGSGATLLITIVLLSVVVLLAVVGVLVRTMISRDTVSREA